MADPVSPSNNNSSPQAPLPSAPPHDWEVLSLSMSSSALGLPGSTSASLVCGCDACTGLDTGNRVPHSVALPLSDQVNASEFSLPGPLSDTGPRGRESEVEGSVSRSGKVGASGSGLPFGSWPDSNPAGGSSSLGVDEGKLDGYAEPEHHHFQAEYQQGTYPDGEETEPLVGFQTEFMVGDEFVIAQESAGERILSDPNLVDADKVPRKKACKGQANTWWKRQAALWRPQSRKSSAMWYIAMAATVLGIVIIGHRWHRERCQNQQLRLELCAKEEKLNELMYQVNRLKEAMTGRRRVPVMRSSSF